jgi:hypothetical protein
MVRPTDFGYDMPDVFCSVVSISSVLRCLIESARECAQPVRQRIVATSGSGKRFAEAAFVS